jgi:hypothetical protein
MGRNDLTKRKVQLFAPGWKVKQLHVVKMNEQPGYTEYQVMFYFKRLHIRIDGGKVWQLGYWNYQYYVCDKKLLGILAH